MESNSQTITLAGETLTEADWPEGCSRFESVNSDNPRLRRWLMKIPDSSTVTGFFWVGYESREFQDACRCWFLDMAEEAWEDSEFSMQCDCPETSRYLASAAKWARIGRSVTK